VASSLGPLSMTSAILSPANGGRLGDNCIEVFGYALAGDDRLIAVVERLRTRLADLGPGSGGRPSQSPGVAAVAHHL
jgi:hypothetical protein